MLNHRLRFPEAHSYFPLATGVLISLASEGFREAGWGTTCKRLGTEQVLETWVVRDVVCFVVSVHLFWRVVEVLGLTQFTLNSILE